MVSDFLPSYPYFDDGCPEALNESDILITVDQWVYAALTHLAQFTEDSRIVDGDLRDASIRKFKIHGFKDFHMLVHTVAGRLCFSFLRSQAMTVVKLMYELNSNMKVGMEIDELVRRCRQVLGSRELAVLDDAGEL